MRESSSLGTVSFNSRDGLALEGVFDHAPESAAAVVLCHPHPQLGGTMNAPLMVALRDHLVGVGWAVLRFNFRGVGRSEGRPSTAEDEVADAGGALDFLARHLPGSPIALAGWSFGAAVAVRLAAQEEIAGCVAIAPPVNPRPGVSSGLPEANTLGIQAPLLVVCGANDEVVSPADVRRWAESVRSARYVEISGANHFFWAKYDALANTVAEFLQTTVI